MKTTFNFKVLFTLGGLALGSALLNSCSKEAVTSGGTMPADKVVKLNDGQVRMIQDVADRIPVLRIYDEENNRFIDCDFQNRDFSFSTPNDGWNFSDGSDVVWEPAEGGGGILFIGSGSIGGNTGGTVVAGNTALDVNYTFCFSASDEALGLDLFDTGANLDGISGVIGIAGDFEALLNDEVDEDSEFTDYFQGFAAYFVYDNEANGSYDVLDWFEDLESDMDDLSDNGFSYVFGFEDFSVYFSVDGTINVSGGSMTFNGEYFAIEDLIFMFEEGEDEPEVSIVDGFGTMGC